MIEVQLFDLLGPARSLAELVHQAAERADTTPEPLALSKEDADECSQHLTLLKPVLCSLELPISADHVTRLINDLAGGFGTPYGLLERLLAAQEAFWDEVKVRSVYYVSVSRLSQIDLNTGFERRTDVCFPEAKAHIVRARKAYLFGLPVASVYHLMLALGCGLKALAEKLDVPVEQEQWGRLLRRVEDAIALERQRLERQPNSGHRNDQLAFYSEAAVHFRYFKDAWRNCTMHGDKDYSDSQSLDIARHVTGFLNHLASGL